jgi:uncharacterized protein DUF2752
MEKDRSSGAAGRMNRRVFAGLAMAAFAALAIVVYNFSPSEYGFYPRCPLYAATHLLCPGCGATRAFYAMLHGDFRAALHYNALFTLLAPFLLAWFAFWCYGMMRYDRVPRLAIPRGVTIGLGIAAVLFTIARNTILVF